MTEHRVIIEQGTPLQKQAFWAAFAVILAIMFWQYALVVLGVSALGYGIYIGVRNANAVQAAAIADLDARRARADQQRNWFEAGDPRAYYGPDYTGGLDEGSVG